MKVADVRRHAMSLPEATEEPHFDCSSFRVRSRIFVTVPPDERHIHVFIDEGEREPALAMYPTFLEKLTWGQKVVGVRVSLAKAEPDVVERLITAAWRRRAPKSLLRASAAPDISPAPAA